MAIYAQWHEFWYIDPCNRWHITGGNEQCLDHARRFIWWNKSLGFRRDRRSVDYMLWLMSLEPDQHHSCCNMSTTSLAIFPNWRRYSTNITLMPRIGTSWEIPILSWTLAKIITDHMASQSCKEHHICFRWRLFLRANFCISEGFFLNLRFEVRTFWCFGLQFSS